jgi:hypothetical protein
MPFLGPQFTDEEIAQQDTVDNAVLDMVRTITGDEGIEWDVEKLGELRDYIIDYIANSPADLTDKTERELYPYIDEQAEEAFADMEYGL